MSRAIVAAALAAAAALEVQARRQERPVPFQAGETLTYDVSWSRFVVAGSAVTTVKEKKPSYGSMAYYIVAEGRPTPIVARLFPLYYKLDTLLDSYALVSQRGSIYTEEGPRHRYREARFEHPAQDPLSALYVLRTIQPRPDTRIALTVTSNGEDYRLTATVGALEQVTTPLGEKSAWKVALTIASATQATVRDAAIWISDDPRRLPVRLQGDLPVGSFNLILRDAR